MWTRLGITNDNLSNSLMMTSAQVFESSVTTTKFKFSFIWAITLLDQLLLLSSNYFTFLICHFFSLIRFQVFQAFDGKRICAIKYVNLEEADDFIVRSYINEVQLLERLQGNDNIIKLFDW